MILDITLRSYIGDLTVDACVTPVKAHTLVQRDRAHRNESRLLSEHTLRHVLESIASSRHVIHLREADAYLILCRHVHRAQRQDRLYGCLGK